MFDKEFKDLWKATRALLKYYDIDKVKPWVVYVWSKEDDIEKTENLFDIYKEEIVFYTKNHYIEPEALNIILKIQEKLKNC